MVVEAHALLWLARASEEEDGRRLSLAEVRKATDCGTGSCAAAARAFGDTVVRARQLANSEHDRSRRWGSPTHCAVARGETRGLNASNQASYMFLIGKNAVKRAFPKSA
jgi:hypothetical protein